MFLPRVFAVIGSVALYPVQQTQQWFTQSTMLFPAMLRDKVSLQQQVIELETELAQRRNASVSEQRLQNENTALRSLLSATASPRIAAGVVARPNQLPYDLMQIDQGSAAGIAVGAPVYSNSEQVIGVVSEVYQYSSLITLLSTPDFRTTAYVAESDILVPLEGLGGGIARVSIPQGIALSIDSVVYLPGIQPGVLGRIVYIENEPTQPQQFGYVSIGVDLQHVRFVSVGSATDIRTDEISVESYVADIQQQLLLPDILVPTSTPTSSIAVATGTAAIGQ